jgi:imidazolonepropionase-like amidohydrolase
MNPDWVKPLAAEAHSLGLRTAFDGDQYLSRDQQYGTLERGKRADFFLVPGDPSRTSVPYDRSGW